MGSSSVPVPSLPALLLLLSIFIITLLSTIRNTSCSPPEDPISCVSGTTDCTIINSYGAFPDRATCRAARAAYPTSEAELIDLVANATSAKQKMKVATRWSHSITKLACPDGQDGLLISTRYLNRVLSVDKENMIMTVESGISLKELMAEAAEAGLALPYMPYWWGLTIGGLMATGAHGSSLWGKGSAVHEYVAGVRIVTPGEPGEGYVKVRDVDEEAKEEFDAVRVSLGVLGVISQVKLRLEPMFKRSLTYAEQNDTDLAEIAPVFGKQHEFADIKWYPAQRKVFYRIDDRVPVHANGDGRYDYVGFHSLSNPVSTTERRDETADELCAISQYLLSMRESAKFGLTNDGNSFTGYPVIGFQHRMQSSGACLDSPEDDFQTVCPWDPKFKLHSLMHQTTISIGLPKVKNFILDIKKLRDLEPKALCGAEVYDGIPFRYVKASSAYLGKQKDSMDFDISYYRSRDPMAPRLYEDVLEEIEQMAVFKYGGYPHWGKNRNLVFDGIIKMYPKINEFLKVKDAYDPYGLFSSEWTDQILGIKGSTSIFGKGCALEGLCVCSEDIHCAPERGYYCRPGRVYKDARVCFHDEILFLSQKQNVYNHQEL